jgi:hypothetical protein
MLLDELTKRAAITEEDLWSRLEQQRKRARMIEERVLAEEKRRLVQLGRTDLAEVVLRISKTDVSAGYDIRSFNVDGTSRYVEVKSSTGQRIRFEWSARERRKATRERQDYWIYFVPLADSLPIDFCPIVLIRDPVARILQAELVEQPMSFLVTEHRFTEIRESQEFSSDHPMFANGVRAGPRAENPVHRQRTSASPREKLRYDNIGKGLAGTRWEKLWRRFSGE